MKMYDAIKITQSDMGWSDRTALIIVMDYIEQIGYQDDFVSFLKQFEETRERAQTDENRSNELEAMPKTSIWDAQWGLLTPVTDEEFAAAKAALEKER